jgi:Cytochrome P460
MKKLRAGLVVTVVAAVSAVAMSAFASGDLVKFPDNFESGVRYATVERGNIRENIFSSGEAIQAVKSGESLLSGTVITLVDYRDGKLFRYVVMEKRLGWGAQYPDSMRNGEWEYQAFNADKSVNRSENLDRCLSCHKSQAAQDFVFTLGQMKAGN